MANKLNRYLNQDPLGPKGILANYQHATDVFVENYYRLAPRFKFLFYAFFDIDNTVKEAEPLLSVRANEEIGLLVKTTDLPSFNYDTVTKNKYNRKKIVYKQINYDPINLTFHDDNAGIMNALWAAYNEYFSNDRKHYNPEAWLIGNTWKDVRYGMDVDTPVRFFKRISLYTLSRQKWNGYTLWGPRIKSWKHGNVDYSEGNGIIENSMVVEYESVSYESGDVSEGNPDGFAGIHYDQEFSPLNTGGGGNSAEIFGQQPEPDFLDPRPSFLDETLASIEDYRDIPLPEGVSADTVFLETESFNQVGGVIGAGFPQDDLEDEETIIATSKTLNQPDNGLSFPETFEGPGGFPPTFSV